ncbi:FKBP12-interacting protein of 37 kDa [Raphanus sativus]|uniref:FKBP12-interacting protein of 37 kDa n=1 Tax=Raphanus sativus TaxID=3726 RepID=A0A6J0P418_RAPSA|nr:FKBP12-interacting protein of 37 kDa [Raphanus sativus]KAJ4895789.1 FKBP12-interacting protein of 37 kDa [Raphanus sativus]
MEFSLQDDEFGGDFPATNATIASGSKRSFDDLEDDEEDNIFGSKKGRTNAEVAAPGATTCVILQLRESLKNCEDELASCQDELESAKAEINKWNSAFQNESFVPAGKSPEPRFLIDYIQNLKSSERSLKEQLEIAKRKEASCIVQYAKREQEMAELKSAVRDLKSQLKPASMQARRLLLDPAIHEEFSRLKNLVEEKDKKIKELQDSYTAVTFTPLGVKGKMLMEKCKTLQEENEEIGRQATEGKIHELAMKLSVQKSQNAELRKQFEGLFKHMEGLTNDVERSNEMVIILQDKLDEKDKELERVKKEMEEVVVADDVGDKKDDEAHDDDEDPKEIDDGEQKMLCTF